MFVQVIKGQVPDAADVQAAWNRWLDEMASDAIGWLVDLGLEVDRIEG